MMSETNDVPTVGHGAPARARPRLVLFWPQAAPMDAVRANALGSVRTNLSTVFLWPQGRNTVFAVQ